MLVGYISQIMWSYRGHFQLQGQLWLLDWIRNFVIRLSITKIVVCNVDFEMNML